MMHLLKEKSVGANIDCLILLSFWAVTYNPSYWR